MSATTSGRKRRTVIFRLFNREMRVRLRWLVLGALMPIVLPLIVVAVFVGWFLFVPAVGVFGGSISPNGLWVAVLENVQYGLAVSPSDDVVVLRPSTGWFAAFYEKEVFRIDNAWTTDKIDLRWNGENELVISYYSTAPVSIRETAYDGIKITYATEPNQ